MSKLKRFIIGAAIALSVAGMAPAIISAVPAFAGTGNQTCYSFSGFACINAWGGGPVVNVYTSLGTVNNDFTLTTIGGYTNIKFTGGGAWNGKCVGDYGNLSGRADTSLDTCGSGWGVNFQLDTTSCGSGAVAFRNNHWSGIEGKSVYLAPANNFSNGSPFYLNTSAIACFTLYGAA